MTTRLHVVEPSTESSTRTHPHARPRKGREGTGRDGKGRDWKLARRFAPCGASHHFVASCIEVPCRALCHKRQTQACFLTTDRARRILIMDRIGRIDLLDLLKLPTRRHEVTRTGEREPIAPHVRSAVWYRDRGTCEMCPNGGRFDGPWHLDHITPWSASGGDATSNLRVLCEAHNMDRSNYHDPAARHRRPATWWCLNCYSIGHQWRWRVTGGLVCPIHGERPCRVVDGYRRWHEMTGEWPNWHGNPCINEEVALTVAYCAHCDNPNALTDRPL